MFVPPGGTVTFLFTDIEGSTQLTQTHPDSMPDALSRHHAILQEAITALNGYLFRTIGDEFNVAFATPLDVLAAALNAQRALHQQSWGETPIRVRMGLHTGLASPRTDDYDGYLTLSHTKRLMSVAYGGQILLSRTTEVLLREQLSQGTTLLDLGEHRLKDFERAERKADDFFRRRGFASAAEFLKQYQRMSAIVVRQPGAIDLWLNPVARHKLPPEIVSAIQRLTRSEE
jgi:class 3 adenylate cyclase